MNKLVIVGVVLMVIAGLLMVVPIPTREKHEASILGAEISVTEKGSSRAPMALSGTLLAVGAIVTVIGATKKRG